MKRHVVLRLEWPNGIEVRKLPLERSESYRVGQVFESDVGTAMVRSVREDEDGVLRVEAFARGPADRRGTQ
ncbi:MAG: hypothetical protein AAF851_21575 [Myxococcota bacterium]